MFNNMFNNSMGGGALIVGVKKRFKVRYIFSSTDQNPFLIYSLF